MLKNYSKELNEAASYVRSLGYHPIFVCLAGSQNYGLDISSDKYQSDFDFKCVILPRLEDLVAGGAPLSTSLHYGNGFIDLKDIRAFMDAVIKCNPSYIEALYTPYYLIVDENIDLFEWILEKRYSLLKDLAPSFVKALCGSFIKIKSGMKSKEADHPDTGYDGKSASHLYRLLVMLRSFRAADGLYLIPEEEDRRYLISLKLESFPKYFVESEIASWDQEMTDIRKALLDELPPLSFKTADFLREKVNDTLFHFCLTDEGKKRGRP